MDHPYDNLIRQAYDSSGGDSRALFETILSVSREIGMDYALACLEQAVIDRRLAWFDAHTAIWRGTGDPLRDGYRLFYQDYLGLAVPRDGEIVEVTDRRWVTRWWNRCPTLEACQALGLDTRVICRRAYERPVQALLGRIDARLRFSRNYEALRPYAPYCEEIISLDEEAPCCDRR
jgi:tRNA(adenine34) deaminase